MFTQDTYTNIILLAARVLAFCIAIPFHEAAHAFVSYKLGDPTARRLGRLTLNPIKHLDPWGFLSMLILGIGWAKPVPIDTRYYKNQKKGMAISAAAGPLSNLLLAYVSLILYKVVFYTHYMNGGIMQVPSVYWVVSTLLYYFTIINATLAVFNLLPIPPFDGSRIFFVFLPDRYYFAIMKYERIIMFAMLALIWFGALSGLLSTLNGALLSGLDWATGYVDVLFRSLIGVIL